MCKRTLSFIAIIGFFTLSVNASSITELSDKGFYEKNAEGWYWHEPGLVIDNTKQKKEPDNVKPLPIKPNQETKEKVVKPTEERMTVAWFKEHLPKIREISINSGKKEDVQKYMYVQRAALDRATEFMTTYIAIANSDPYLSESLRRPEVEAVLTEHKVSQNRRSEQLFKNLGKENTIIYFYSGNCVYCQIQTPHLKRIKDEYGWKILPVSIDGSAVPGDDFNDFPQFKVADHGIKQKFAVVTTPTLYFANDKSRDFFILYSGMAPMQTIIERSIEVAFTEKIITKEQYNDQAQIRNLLMTDAKDTIDTERLYNDADYLVGKMRKKLLGLSDNTTDEKSEK